MLSPNSIAFFLLLVCFAASAPVEVIFASPNGTDPYLDRECGMTLENLWLEIVFVVDNSKGMTDDGLTAVAADMMAVLAGVNIGISASNPRTTRVAIVTYNKEATVVADLNVFTSYNDFVNSIFTNIAKVSTIDESYLSTGLSAAEQVLEDGAQDDRALFKQVVIVYASTYRENGDNNPLPVADRLKTDDVAITTVAYAQNNEGALLLKLAKIASPHMNFTSTDGDKLPGEIQTALLQVNCFCPNGWRQYQQSFNDTSSKKFGVCIKPLDLVTTWFGAKMSCSRQWTNGYLVNEYTQHKHDFVLSAAKNHSAFVYPYKYHIGLSYYSNNWYWEQPFNAAGRPTTTGSFIDWNPGYPLIDSTKVVAINSAYNTSDFSTGWQNIDRSKESHFYVCEVASCDSDNFCTDVNN